MSKEAREKRIAAIDREIEGRLYDIIGYSADSNVDKIKQLRKEKHKLQHPWWKFGSKS